MPKSGGGGGIASAIPEVLSVLKELSQHVPHVEDEVVVEVVGQPGATKQQLYYLALTTACGLIKRFDVAINSTFIAPPPGLLMVEYDAADNWVRCTLRYRTSLLTAVVATKPSLVFSLIGNGIAQQILNYVFNSDSALPLYAELVVYSGPKETVIGKPFNFTGFAAPGIPNSANSKGVPNLPFAGKTILTTQPTCPDPNPAFPGPGGPPIPTPDPKPPGDNRSRGVVIEALSNNPSGLVGDNTVVAKLIPLVFSALTDPGSLAREQFIPPTPGPLGD